MPVFLWLICVLTCAVVVLIAAFMFRMKQLNSYMKNIPKIPCSMLAPFLVFRPNKTQAEIFQDLEKIINYYDGLAYFCVGTQLTVLCDDPVNLKTILMSKDCVNKPYFYRMMAAAGRGIFTSTSMSDTEYFTICMRIYIQISFPYGFFSYRNSGSS